MKGWLKTLLQYSITAAIGICVAVVIMAVKGLFGGAELAAKDVYQILCDAFFVPGVIIGGVGLIVFASHGGVFDMLGYAVRLFFDLFRRDVTKRKYRDFYEYKEAKKDKQRSSILFLLFTIIRREARKFLRKFTKMYLHFVFFVLECS